MTNKALKLNKAMVNPDSLLEENINIVDRCGRDLGTVDLQIAKHLVESGEYYVATTQDIAMF